MRYNFHLASRFAVRASTNIRNLGNALRNRHKFGSVSGRPLVYISHCEPGLERYFYLLCRFFADAGWNVAVKFSPNLLLNLRNYNERIYNIDSLKVVFSKPVCDLALDTIDVDYFGGTEPDAFAMPYSMHPDVYDLGIDVRALRDRLRSVRVLFAGNSGRPYDNPDIKTLFGKINRMRVEELFEPIAAVIRENVPLRGDAVLLKKEVRLSFPAWMGLLASTDFYIAAPGVSMPFSHNAVEAMAVGAIPIIEYGEMFRPALTDGVNCVAFSGERDFLVQVQRCLSMTASEVAKLRNGVIEYYESHIAPHAVVRNMTAKPFSKLYMNAEHLSVMAFSHRNNV